MILTAVFVLLGQSWGESCVPAREFVSYSHPKAYGRIHPTGDYIIITVAGNDDGNDVLILDIHERDSKGNRKVRVIPSPMGQEAYPAEGSWEWIASPRGIGSFSYGNTTWNRSEMRYHSFNKMKGQADARNVRYEFKDGVLVGSYHSLAEMPGSNANEKLIRTTTWSNRSRDYKVTLNGDGVATVKKGEIYTLCKNIVYSKYSDSVQLYEKRESLKRQSELLMERVEDFEDQLNDKTKNMSTQERRSIEEQIKDLLRQGVAVDNELFKTATDRVRYFENPILSKDATRIAALRLEEGEKEETIHIYHIKDDKSCDLVAKTPYRGSKVSFSYPENGKEPKIVFSTVGGPSDSYKSRVVVFDPNTGHDQIVGNLDVDDPYPGFLEDGRIFFGRSDGFEIVDPHQLSGSTEKCIRLHSKPEDEVKNKASAVH